MHWQLMRAFAVCVDPSGGNGGVQTYCWMCCEWYVMNDSMQTDEWDEQSMMSRWFSVSGRM